MTTTWTTRNTNSILTVGDVLAGAMTIRIKQVNGKFNAAYTLPDHCRFDAPNAIGTFGTLEEAKAQAVKITQSIPWLAGYWKAA